MTYVGWDGREYEDPERENMREQPPKTSPRNEAAERLRASFFKLPVPSGIWYRDWMTLLDRALAEERRLAILSIRADVTPLTHSHSERYPEVNGFPPGYEPSTPPCPACDIEANRSR